METTTVSVPVYDKTNPDRWKFLGVAGIDAVVCALEKTLLDKNPNMQVVAGRLSRAPRAHLEKPAICEHLLPFDDK